MYFRRARAEIIIFHNTPSGRNGQHSSGNLGSLYHCLPPNLVSMADKLAASPSQEGWLWEIMFLFQ